MNKIYMDNAATTRVAQPVLEAMIPYLTEAYGNASSVHSFGRDAHKALDRARGQVAAALGADPQEIYFTGSGTRSNKLGGSRRRLCKKAQGDAPDYISHRASRGAVRLDQLEVEGFEVTRLPVDGGHRPADLEKSHAPGHHAGVDHDGQQRNRRH